MLLVEKIGLWFCVKVATHTTRMLCWNNMYTEFKNIVDDSPLYRFMFGGFIFLCFGELIGTLLCLNSLSMSQCSSLVAIAVPVTPIGTIVAAMTIQYIVCSYMRKPILPKTMADVKQTSSPVTTPPTSEDETRETGFTGTNPLRVTRIAVTPQKVRSSATAPPQPPAPKKERRILDDDFTDVNPMKLDTSAAGSGLV
jgi:hypothetical protein